MANVSPMDYVHVDTDARVRLAFVQKVMREYEHMVTPTIGSIVDQTDWLDLRSIDYQWVSTGIFVFKSDSDAMMFKLTWG